MKKSKQTPRPFLKWAGGKTKLLSEIVQRLPTAFGHYHEPFLGGGAVFFHLQVLGKLDCDGATLSDLNTDLVTTYNIIKTRWRQVAQALDLLQDEYSEDQYYRIRAWKPKDLTGIARAVRFIYLNKTCFNGLYRVNKKGEFNVPFGRRKRAPQLYDADNLEAVSKALRSAARPVVLRAAQGWMMDHYLPGDLVYYDPPYHPVTDTSFTTYTAGGFREEDQMWLARRCSQLAKRGVYVMISNSDTPLIRRLYKDFRCEPVLVGRSINSNASDRGKVTELLITSY